MPIKGAKIVFMQGNVFCIYPKSAKHITDIRGMSVFECSGDSLDLKPIQEGTSRQRSGKEDLNIMNMSCERYM